MRSGEARCHALAQFARNGDWRGASERPRRCVLQLTVLGYVLVPIFTYKLWWLVLLYACFMLLMGSWEASSRPSQTYTVSIYWPYQSR